MSTPGRAVYQHVHDLSFHLLVGVHLVLLSLFICPEVTSAYLFANGVLVHLRWGHCECAASRSVLLRSSRR
ncbi:hypothetical protein EDD16DRAFT_1556017 [Pisolithus croceorrhizus]|nr:hypothetical protein EDD16DRAFT_1556017 [Pisolithus croceorrhizus]